MCIRDRVSAMSGPPFHGWCGIRLEALVIQYGQEEGFRPLFFTIIPGLNLYKKYKRWLARCTSPANSPLQRALLLSLIHISEPTRRTPISYAVFCLKKKKKH